MASRTRLPGRLAPVLWAAPGLLIALAAWPTQTGPTARFFLGVLVGMSLVALGAGISAYVRDAHTRRTDHLDGRTRR